MMSDADLHREIGRRIREARAISGKTQQRVADEVFSSLATVSNWEAGKYGPTSVNVIRLSVSLGVAVQWLLLGEEGAAGG